MTEPGDKVAPGDLFADLQKEKQISEQTARILEYAPSMLEAREQRGVTWRQLANRLEQVGIKIAPEYLRSLMERHAATIRATPKGSRSALPPVLVVKRKKKEAPVVSTPPAITKNQDTPRNDGAPVSGDATENVKRL